MADGGLIEPIPFQTALDEGATHVLVLRSMLPGYRQPALSALGESLALRNDPGLVELIRAGNGVNNRQADELERGPAPRSGAASIQQITVPGHTRVIGRLNSNGQRVIEALRMGARAIGSAILTEPIDLCWPPVVYQTTAADQRARQRTTASPALPAAMSSAAEMGR